MKRVLFVDDEENVLQGLKVMLYPMRSSWNMEFAQGGDAALELLEKGPEYDIVVTDIHMPGLHGVELLKILIERSPETVRFVLSGNLNSDTLVEAASVAHQVIAKPCDPDHLRAVIARAFTLRERLADSSIKKALLGLGTLPSVPVLYWEIVNEVNSPEPSIDRVAKIISKDPGMSAKVIQLVNAHTGPKNRLASIAHAAKSLGLDQIKNFVLMAEIYSGVDQSQIANGFSVDQLWKHGLEVGGYAKRVADFETEDRKMIDDSYTAGLLHDIGLLILASKMPDEFEEVFEYANECGVTLFEAEREKLGATHAEFGAYLLDLWGLPDPVVKAICLHYFPSGSPEELYEFNPKEGFSPLTAVHIANYFSEEQDLTESDYGRAELDMVYLERAGLGDRPDVWWDICNQDEEEEVEA